MITAVLSLAVFGFATLSVAAVFLASWIIVGFLRLAGRSWHRWRLRRRLRALEVGTCDGLAARRRAALVAEATERRRR